MQFCMTLFSNFTNFGTVTLLILGVILFALLCPWRNLPSNLDTLLKSLWRLSGPVAVTWAVFVLVLIGSTAYAILLLVHHLGSVGTNTDHLRQIILAIPVLIAALAGLIALPVTLIRLHYTRRQTLAEEEGLITDRINAAVLGLGAEKTVKVTEEGKVVERTEPNIEVRIGAILALERIAKKNLDEHVQIMELLIAYIANNSRPIERFKGLGNDHVSSEDNSVVTPDIQSVFDVLCRRNEEQVFEERNVKFVFDLTDINTRGAKFKNTRGDRTSDLQGFFFEHRALEKAAFICCDLRGSNLTDFKLQKFLNVQKCLFDSDQVDGSAKKFDYSKNFANFSQDHTYEDIPKFWPERNITGEALKSEWQKWLLSSNKYKPPHLRK